MADEPILGLPAAGPRHGSTVAIGFRLHAKYAAVLAADLSVWRFSELLLTSADFL